MAPLNPSIQREEDRPKDRLVIPPCPHFGKDGGQIVSGLITMLYAQCLACGEVWGVQRPGGKPDESPSGLPTDNCQTLDGSSLVRLEVGASIHTPCERTDTGCL